MTALNRGPAVVAFITLKSLARQASSLAGCLPDGHPAAGFFLAVNATGDAIHRCTTAVDSAKPDEQAQGDLQILAALEFAQGQFDQAMELIRQNPFPDEDGVNWQEYKLRWAAWSGLMLRFYKARDALVEIDSTKGGVANLPNVFLDAAEGAMIMMQQRWHHAVNGPPAVAAFDISMVQCNKAVDEVVALIVKALTP